MMSASRRILCALTLVLSAISLPVHADEDEGEADLTGDGDEQYWNTFGLKFGFLFSANRARTSVPGREPPGTEILLGIVPSYSRVLIPGRLTFDVALPFFANLDRFDTPLDLTLIFMTRLGRFEPFFSLGGTFNAKIFPGERGETEGTSVEFVAGITGAVGLAYALDRRWLLEVEIGYSWIPTSAIVEHEIATIMGFGYLF